MIPCALFVLDKMQKHLVNKWPIEIQKKLVVNADLVDIH